jgi:hypothetical protein
MGGAAYRLPASHERWKATGVVQESRQLTVARGLRGAAAAAMGGGRVWSDDRQVTHVSWSGDRTSRNRPERVEIAFKITNWPSSRVCRVAGSAFVCVAALRCAASVVGAIRRCRCRCRCRCRWRWWMGGGGGGGSGGDGDGDGDGGGGDGGGNEPRGTARAGRQKEGRTRVAPSRAAHDAPRDPEDVFRCRLVVPAVSSGAHPPDRRGVPDARRLLAPLPLTVPENAPSESRSEPSGSRGAADAEADTEPTEPPSRYNMYTCCVAVTRCASADKPSAARCATWPCPSTAPPTAPPPPSPPAARHLLTPARS